MSVNIEWNPIFIIAVLIMLTHMTSHFGRESWQGLMANICMSLVVFGWWLTSPHKQSVLSTTPPLYG